MKLVDVYEMQRTEAENYLWYLLKERTPEQSISHKEMPTFKQHVDFIESKLYEHWYLIQDEELKRTWSPDKSAYVGSIYLTKQREIGVFIFNNFKGHKYGKKAVQMLMEKHPGKFYTNVNPANEPSIKLWESLEFKLIQYTYEK